MILAPLADVEVPIIARLHGKLARQSGADLLSKGGQPGLIRQRQRGAGRFDLQGRAVLRGEIGADLLADGEACRQRRKIARASTAERQAHARAFEIVGALEGVAGEFAALGRIEEEGDGVEAALDLCPIARRAAEAECQKAGAGGRDRAVNGCDKRTLALTPR